MRALRNLILCEECDKVATYTIKPQGGVTSYWCIQHFNAVVKGL